jgi:hypothetical protein
MTEEAARIQRAMERKRGPARDKISRAQVGKYTLNLTHQSIS